MPQIIRSLGIAGLAGGISSVASSFIYAFTHGTTTVNKMESVFGLDELEWGRVAAIIPLLLWAALVAFRLRAGDRLNRLSNYGYWMASASLALRFFSEIPQFFIDMRTEYNSPLGISSWMLYLLSLLLLTIGMLLLGIGCYRSGMRGSAYLAPLCVGLLIIPTLAAGGLLANISDDSAIFRWSFGLLTVPSGLTWSWLSIQGAPPSR